VQELARETGTALIWITHDLAVVAGLADKISVMYAGRIVESGPTDAVLRAPGHPYTEGLLGSIPGHGRRGERLAQIPGMAPNMARLPDGCAFGPRCPRVSDICRENAPAITDIGPRRGLRCHHPSTATEGAA
jgi:peptide/nickel transport system ATP-binding protein